MFPYSFPNLIVALSILILTFTEISTHVESKYIELFPRIVFFVIFILLAKQYYKDQPNTIGEKTFIISFNLSIIPLIIANIYVISDFFDGEEFGKSILAYIFPFIYTPIIFLISFVVLFIFFKFVSKKHKKTE